MNEKTIRQDVEGTPAAPGWPRVGGLQQIWSAAETEEVLRSPVIERRGEGEHTHVEQAGFILGGTVVNVEGGAHSHRRRIASALVNQAALKAMGEWLVPVIARRLSAVPAAADGRRRVDMVEFGRDIALDIAARIIGFNDMDPTHRLRQLGGIADSLNRTIKAHLEFEEDPAHSAVQAGADSTAARETFMSQRIAAGKQAKQDFIDDFYVPARRLREERVAAWRAGRIAASELPQDFITLLILNEAELRADPSWDDDLPVRECILLLTAADLTTAMAVCHAIADIEAWLPDHPGDRSNLQSINFLHDCVQESLRLHQVSDPGPNFRYATDNVTLSTGRSIAKGEMIVLWYGVASRDQSVFGEDAGRFDPYRREKLKLRKPYGFAFSGGVHACLGQTLVVGTGSGAQYKGDIALMLREFYAAGMRPDPERPGIPFAHTYSSKEDGGRRVIHLWRSFAVVFDLESKAHEHLV